MIGVKEPELGEEDEGLREAVIKWAEEVMAAQGW